MILSSETLTWKIKLVALTFKRVWNVTRFLNSTFLRFSSVRLSLLIIVVFKL